MVLGGYVLAVREGLQDDLVSAQRGGNRKLKRLEAVAAYLRDIGAKEFVVELGQWAPTSLDI